MLNSYFGSSDKNCKTYVIHSYKFSPGHYNILKAIMASTEHPEFFSTSTCIGYYHFDSELEKMRSKNAFGDINIHLNSSILSLLKIGISRIFGKKNIIFLHEPIKDLHKKLSRYTSLKEKIHLCLVAFFNDLICALSDKVIVFSLNSLENTPSKILDKTHQIFLPFIDPLANVTKSNVVRNSEIVVSYIGSIANDHAFDEFVSWVLASKLLPQQVSFRVYTKSQISSKVISLLAGKCELVYGYFMSESEINEAYQESTFTWCAYRSANQSGVLPAAISNSSIPLISAAFGPDTARYKNCSVYINDYAPGALDEQIRAAIPRIKSLKSSTRSTFEKYHDTSFFKWKEILYV